MSTWIPILIIVLVAIGVLAVLVVARRLPGTTTETPPRPGDRDAVPPEEPAGTGPGAATALAEPPVVEPATPVKPRLRDRLAKARSTVAGYLASVVGRSGISQETWDELEEALIRADVGVQLTTDVLDGLRAQVDAESISDPNELLGILRADLTARLEMTDRSLRLDDDTTNVWLVVGVNGVGKTTTIGKLGARYTGADTDVVMVAGDTFRAAAAEQLQTWADRCGAQFVRGAEGADPSSVVFDGIEAGAARGAGLVLADTAGRLHTKSNLMDELAKVRRVADKAPGEVTEVLLVIDATTGQNGLTQAKVFTEATEVTGVVLTKLDGSAKGGIVMAIQTELGIPVKLVGLGEGADDLVDFEPAEFVEALLSVEEVA